MKLSTIDIRNKKPDDYFANKRTYSSIVTELFCANLNRISECIKILLYCYFDQANRQNCIINILMELSCQIAYQAAINTMAHLRQLIKKFFTRNNVAFVSCILSVFDNQKMFSIASTCKGN